LKRGYYDRGFLVYVPGQKVKGVHKRIHMAKFSGLSENVGQYRIFLPLGIRMGNILLGGEKYRHSG